MSDCEVIVEAACQMPARLKWRDISPHAYVMRHVRQADIESSRACLTRAAARRYLRDHPYLIEHWLAWSAEKRTDRGWYFAKRGPLYVVGYHPRGLVRPFLDRSNACAAFAIREVESILENSERMRARRRPARGR